MACCWIKHRDYFAAGLVIHAETWNLGPGAETCTAKSENSNGRIKIYRYIRAPGAHWIGGGVAPTAGLGAAARCGTEKNRLRLRRV